jgi:hypothetical protein
MKMGAERDQCLLPNAYYSSVARAISCPDRPVEAAYVNGYNEPRTHDDPTCKGGRGPARFTTIRPGL